MLNVTPIPAFTDNYIWCFSNSEPHRESADRQAFIVDPGDATPVLAALERMELSLAGIFITHHHFDHTGGLDALLAHRQVPVYGPHNPAIPQVSIPLGEGDSIDVLGHRWQIFTVPGHTLDHIAYFSQGSDGEPPLLFCGDTLFAGGCGRLFEGDPAMMHDSLSKLAALPAETRVYCAHEYTLANLKFAAAVEPANRQLQQRIERDEERRRAQQPTVPSTLATELETNPFLRCSAPSVCEQVQERDGTDPQDPVAVFAAVRGWKDNF